MKTNKFIVIATVIAIASVSCNKQESSTVASAAESGAKPYPLDTCLVSGEKLGSMGDPVVINHEGQEIKFCCDTCVPKFKKDPEKYLSQLTRQNHTH